MTSFTLQGTFLGKLTSITWMDGELSGDDDFLVELVQRDAAGYEGHMIASSAGITSEHNHLKDPYIAHTLISRWLAEKQPEIIAGELPPIPEPPKGAVM